MQAVAIAEVEPTDRSAAASITGYVDAISGNRIFGWAWDPQRPTARVAIRFMMEGGDITALIADQRREDLVANGVGDGAHAFEATLPDGVSPEGVQVLAVCPESGEAIELARAPVPTPGESSNASAALHEIIGRLVRSQRTLHGNLQVAIAAIETLRKARAESADGPDEDDRRAREALLTERMETMEVALLRVDGLLAEHGMLLPTLRHLGVDRVSRVLASSAFFLAIAALFVTLLH